MTFRQGNIERSAQQAEAPLIDIPLTKLTSYKSATPPLSKIRLAKREGQRSIPRPPSVTS